MTNFPLIDYHVHLTDDFTIDEAVELSARRQVKFGIVEHPGPQYHLQNDDDLQQYIDRLRNYPVYIGLQPVYRNWADQFSPRVLEQLDYVLMDADTVPLDNGEYLRIWQHNNYIDDVGEFMARYMNHIDGILRHEPITIFARPTYLPINFARYYDQLWTEERLQLMINLAAQRDIAFEISTPMHVPSPAVITAAKAAGLKFTFGTNARNNSAGKLHYGLQVVETCGLSAGDMLLL